MVRSLRYLATWVPEIRLRVTSHCKPGAETPLAERVAWGRGDEPPVPALLKMGKRLPSWGDQ